MKQIKILASAVALATSGSAFAIVGDPASSATGGEMLLSIWSPSAQVSYALDIGLLYADFAAKALAATAGGAPYSFSLAINPETDRAYNTNNGTLFFRYDDNFQKFLTAVEGKTDVSFSFIGGDNSGVPANARSMATTVRPGGDVTKVTSGNLVDGMNSIQANYVSNTDNGVSIRAGAPTIAGNGSGFFTVADGPGYYLFFGQDTLNGKFAIGNDNPLGSSANVYHFVRSTTSTLSDATETLVGKAYLAQTAADQYSFVFTATEVPEPSTYALMGLGLVGLSLVARRRV